MGKFKLIFTLLIIICINNLPAQDKKWTLEECITYAITNNIGLQRQQLQTEVTEVNLMKSRMDLLPSLNLGSDASIQYGRSIDPRTNGVTFSQNLRNGYDLSSSLTLFNGFATLNTISANKFMHKAGLETDKINRNTLVVDIMGQYYLVLYTRGLEKASEMQMGLSEKQLLRIQKMVETGKEAESRLYEIESRLSSDKLAFTVAKNTANQALTSLKQMLQLLPGTEFDILMPDLNEMVIPDASFKPDSIYNLASRTLPRLRAIEYELNASKKQLAAARGRLAPSLSVGGSLFTGYYTALGDTLAASFSNQLNNNFGQAVFASVNIPIFNNYSTVRSIKIAKINQKDKELRLELEKNNLYTDIENACLSFNRGKDEFSAAAANFEYNKKSFNSVEKKFESGLVDVTDYSAAKTILYSAETEALRTKLQLLIRKLTIQFYITGEYTNLIN